jgi:thioredoxin 1
MNPPTEGSRAPWLLIVGMILGGGLLVVMTWDSFRGNSQTAGDAGVVEFTSANWQAEVIDSDVPVFVDFTAKWCGPCQGFAPTVSRLAERYRGKVKVGKLDVGDQSFNKAKKLQAEFPFNSIPQVMIFKGGKAIFISQPRDLSSEDKLRQIIDSTL